jgi:hypothetical protein
MKVLLYKNFVDENGNKCSQQESIDVDTIWVNDNTIEIDSINNRQQIININKTHYISDIIIVMDK